MHPLRMRNASHAVSPVRGSSGGCLKMHRCFLVLIHTWLLCSCRSGRRLQAAHADTDADAGVHLAAHASAYSSDKTVHAGRRLSSQVATLGQFSRVATNFDAVTKTRPDLTDGGYYFIYAVTQDFAGNVSPVSQQWIVHTSGGAPECTAVCDPARATLTSIMLDVTLDKAGTVFYTFHAEDNHSAVPVTDVRSASKLGLLCLYWRQPRMQA